MPHTTVLALRRRARRHGKPLIVLSLLAAAAIYHSSPSTFTIPDTFDLPEYMRNPESIFSAPTRASYNLDPDHALWDGYLAGQLRQNRRKVIEDYGIQDDVPDEDVFDPLLRRDETACEGWDPLVPEEDETWRTCWRAKMWRQIDGFDIPHSMR